MKRELMTPRQSKVMGDLRKGWRLHYAYLLYPCTPIASICCEKIACRPPKGDLDQGHKYNVSPGTFHAMLRRDLVKKEAGKGTSPRLPCAGWVQVGRVRVYGPS